MTEAEIIKALDFCEGYNGISFCNDCPLFDEDNCIHILSHEALDLINRQNAEIERLREENIKLHTIIPKMIFVAKSEARKEFAEMLKQNKHECGCNYRKKPVYAVTEEKIDNLLAEMESESNA